MNITSKHLRTRIYRDNHTGGWIAEFCFAGEREWVRLGVFGSRKAALVALA